jgi:hypothetical protein
MQAFVCCFKSINLCSYFSQSSDSNNIQEFIPLIPISQGRAVGVRLWLYAFSNGLACARRYGSDGCARGREVAFCRRRGMWLRSKRHLLCPNLWLQFCPATLTFFRWWSSRLMTRIRLEQLSSAPWTCVTSHENYHTRRVNNREITLTPFRWFLAASLQSTLMLPCRIWMLAPPWCLWRILRLQHGLRYSFFPGLL